MTNAAPSARGLFRSTGKTSTHVVRPRCVRGAIGGAASVLMRKHTKRRARSTTIFIDEVVNRKFRVAFYRSDDAEW
jgi:hypothetical protein